jgi:hypothetical protein
MSDGSACVNSLLTNDPATQAEKNFLLFDHVPFVKEIFSSAPPLFFKQTVA